MNALPTLLAQVGPSGGGAKNIVDWFHMRGPRDQYGAIPDQIWITLWHSLVAAGVAIAVAVPLAIWLAHYRRAEALSTAVVNLGRVIPTVGVLGIAVTVSLRNGLGFEPWPILITLVLLGLPPIFANTYTAIRGVDADVVQAARAIGHTERSIMGRVELPLGAPVILAGIRVAVVQLVATEVIGSYFGGEGLGVYIRQGLQVGPIAQVQAGALLVAATALACDAVLALAARLAFGRRSGVARRTDRTIEPTVNEAQQPSLEGTQ